MLVIASIHQPSTNTLLLFDHVLLLSRGHTIYYGPPANSMRYFISLGCPPPPLLSPAEFMLELSNTNFDNSTDALDVVDVLCEAWGNSLECRLLLDKIVAVRPEDPQEANFQIRRGATTGRIMKPFILLHRMAIVSRVADFPDIRNPIEILSRMVSELRCISGLRYSWVPGGFDCRIRRPTSKMFLILYSSALLS